MAFNVLNTSNRFVYSILDVSYKLTDPLLNYIRRFLPNLGSIDISPVVLILGLMFLRNLVFSTGEIIFNGNHKTQLSQR